MQVKEFHNNVQQGGVVGERSNFGIAYNSKMFKTLSGSLYQDKPGSIVREIVCNAVDAHRAAGTSDIPVEVHVPNALEPWFSVKDYGVGLSDDSVRKVYAIYGLSTKDQSNDEIGAFGLGAKTPFAYTDQFIISSIFDGVKRIYVAVIGNDGLPHISLQSESDTDEHPGVEVTLAVNDADNRSFHRAIRDQLRFLPVLPKLVNNLDGLAIMDISQGVKMSNEYVTIYEETSSPVNGIWVTQGGVGYPLNLASLGVDIPSNVMSFADALRKHGATIDFPIGEIEVTASREGISYEGDTIKNIIARLLLVSQSLCRDAMKEILATDSQWERAVLFNAQIRVVQRAIKNNQKFDKIFTAFKVDDRTKDMVFRVERLNDIDVIGVLMEKHTYMKRESHERGVRVKRRNINYLDDGYYGYYGARLTPDGDINVFVRDTNSKPVARIKKFCEENGYPKTLVVEAVSSEVEIDAAMISKIADAFCIDVSRVKRLSALPAPAAKGRKHDARPRAYRYDPQNAEHSSNRSVAWDAEYDKLDDLDDGVVIPMDRHQLGASGADLGMFMAAIKMNLIDMPVYAVNNQTAKKFLDGKIGQQHITVETALAQIEDKVAAATRHVEAYNKYEGFLHGCNNKLINGIMHRVEGLKVVGNLQVVRDRMEVLKARAGGFWDLVQGKNSTTGNYTAGHKAGEVRSAAFFDRYPMLRHITIPYHSEGRDDLFDSAAEYIKLVEKVETGA